MGIDAGGIQPQRLFDPAQLFEAFLPIEQGEPAQAVKGVSGRYLIVGLAVFFASPELGHGFFENASQPGLNRGQRGFLVIKVVNQLRGERRAWAGLGFRQFRHERKELVGILTVDGNKPVRPEPGRLAFTQFRQGSSGEPLDALEQRNPQHLGDSPEFGDRKRTNRLIGLDEGLDVLLIQVQIGVRSQFPGQTVDARQPPVDAVGEGRQLSVKTPGQVQKDVTGVALEEIFVVEEPFAGRRRGLLHTIGFGEIQACLLELPETLIESLEQSGVPERFRVHLMLRGQTPGMVSQLRRVERRFPGALALSD